MLKGNCQQHCNATTPCVYNLLRAIMKLCSLYGVAAVAFFVSTVEASTVLLDKSSNNIRLQIPEVDVSNGVVTLITSPGTPSYFATDGGDDEAESVLSLTDGSESTAALVCRGATLSGSSDVERNALATCSLASDVLVIDGVTAGDIEAGLKNSRHARTLTALFRARLSLEKTIGGHHASTGGSNNSGPQALYVAIRDTENNAVDQENLKNEISTLFEAVAAEMKSDRAFDSLYKIHLMKVNSMMDASQTLLTAIEAAKLSPRGGGPLSLALSSVYNVVRESGVGAVALDPPHVAQAFITVGNLFSKNLRTARAKIAAWKSRTARGLVVDHFGRDAETLRKKVVGGFEKETLAYAGLPLVSAYRTELRTQLQSTVDNAIRESFAAQLNNLEKSISKRFSSQLLKTVNESAETQVKKSTSLLQSEVYEFEKTLENLQVASLGLTKAQPSRDLTAKLNDVLASFPDSPAAKLKRTKKVKTIVNKNKKPGQRSLDFGLDLVAMLRPDGYGSLQGFAGYQLGGNSITFGIHNDADDPQVIAQFGGVRPPLLRVQPKLRLDVEL